MAVMSSEYCSAAKVPANSRAVCSPLLLADEAHDLYFGAEKTKKLKKLKKQWDPERVYDYPHAF